MISNVVDVRVLKTSVFNCVPRQTFDHINNSFCHIVFLLVAHNTTKLLAHEISLALPFG